MRRGIFKTGLDRVVFVVLFISIHAAVVGSSYRATWYDPLTASAKFPGPDQPPAADRN
ncbi:hypothetical protein GALMADRAFT_253488 [Galerina marginata CBS 339.88]|uniref:Uncharacterized protein n=1 Tax=Galerina marginata (strain CBS 339.88) TaxID=685588 RepID=A0A067SNX1_GALM3|nr:hypothetical protein GALMADRAFT_253488 [Galerina marginata CBS 339.88]